MIGDGMNLITDPAYMGVRGNIYNSILIDGDDQPQGFHTPTPYEWTVVGIYLLAVAAICYFGFIRGLQ